MSIELFTRNAVQQKSTNVIPHNFNLITGKYLEYNKVPVKLKKIDRQKWSSEFNKLAIMRHLEAELNLDDECIVKCKINTLSDYHLGGMGIHALSGAIISSLMDCVVGVSGVLQYPGKKAGTVELSIKIIRPLFGRSACAEGFVTKKAKHISFCEGFLYDDHNKLCARVTGIVSKA